MPSIDMALCAHVVHGGTWKKVSDAGLLPVHLFDDGKRVFDHIRNHFAQFGKVPDSQTVVKDTGITVPPLADVPEPVDYYIQKIRERATDNLVKEKVKQQVELLEKGKADEAVDAAKSMLQEISRQNLAGIPIGNWVEKTDERWDAYQKAKAAPAGLIGLPTPWPTLNDMTQGLQPGDLWILVGRPSTGKSWTEIVLSKHLWLAGYSPLLVSLEMPPAKMYRRLDAAYAKMDYRNLRKGQLGMIAEPAYKTALDSLKGKHPLHVVTRLRVKTVQDIAILIEELKPQATIIDGLYKLRVPGMRGVAAPWERMMEVIDQLQELAQSKEHPVFASTQFSRQVRKGQTKAELGMLAFADAIGMNADVIVGLLPSNQMRNDRETLMRLLKNREDDLAAFRAKFNTMTQEYDEIGPWTDVDDEDAGSDDPTDTDTGVDFT